MKRENNMNIWEYIKSLEGKTLKTLAQKRPFDVSVVSDEYVIVIPHTKMIPRSIKRIEIEGANRALRIRESISARDIQKEFSLFNSSFVSSLLAHLPAVEYKSNPIRLYYKQ